MTKEIFSPKEKLKSERRYSRTYEMMCETELSGRQNIFGNWTQYSGKRTSNQFGNFGVGVSCFVEAFLQQDLTWAAHHHGLHMTLYPVWESRNMWEDPWTNGSWGRIRPNDPKYPAKFTKYKLKTKNCWVLRLVRCCQKNLTGDFSLQE